MLQKKISQDYIDAMKAKDKARAATLSFLRAQIKNLMIDQRIEEVDDAQVVGVLKKQLKQRQDSVESFEKGGRSELADKERAEIEIIKQYLPEEMSAQDVEAIVDQVIQDVGATSIKDMGKVMKPVLDQTAGRADGKLVSETVKSKLTAL